MIILYQLSNKTGRAILSGVYVYDRDVVVTRPKTCCDSKILISFILKS